LSRFSAKRGIVVTMTLACAAASHGRQVGVNGPAALPQPAPATTATAPPPPETEDQRAATPAAPVSESRPLGKPNSMLSGRPAETDAKPESATGALGDLDPRSNDITRVLGALAAVIGLILLTKTVVWRYFPNLLRLGGASGAGERPSGVIEVLARYPLPGGGRGQQLIVLKFARRVLLAHQAGTTLRTLSEMTDPNEVAGLLSRLEAGASEKSQQKFRAALERFEDEHDSALARQSRAGASVAAGQTEIIDLTRMPMRGISSGVVRARRLLR
jgi:hypothetical protein